ncbi:MAG: protein kinase [Synechococcales cyanobacterium RU_4_20]|nr:protein kinase [Synechococcales cyanobacterium RU_4_20]
MVQDYVEGRPYSEILSERLSQGRAFSPNEVLEFVRQLLPVLNHIHKKGIIHRDISPDNVMHREQDAQPVLIDFGVVKAIAPSSRMTAAAAPLPWASRAMPPANKFGAARFTPVVICLP